jgi:hypothetical protein
MASALAPSPGKNRAANAELRRADANARPIVDLTYGVTDVQNVEPEFGACPKSEVEFLDHACVDGHIFRQGGAIGHRWSACAQTPWLRRSTHWHEKAQTLRGAVGGLGGR